MRHEPQGFVMFVVVIVLAMLCTVGMGIWYTMSLQTDILYQRERHIRQQIMIEQVMRQVIVFVEKHELALFSKKQRARTLSFCLSQPGDVLLRFDITISDYQDKQKRPTKLISVCFIKNGHNIDMQRCLLSLMLNQDAEKKERKYVVHHYTFGSAL